MHDRSRKANDPGVGYRAVTRQMKEQDGGGVGGLPKRFKKKKKKKCATRAAGSDPGNTQQTPADCRDT